MAGCYRTVASSFGNYAYGNTQTFLSSPFVDQQNEEVVPLGNLQDNFFMPQGQGYGMPPAPIVMPQGQGYGMPPAPVVMPQGQGSGVLSFQQPGQDNYSSNNLQFLHDQLTRARLELELQKVKSNSDRKYGFVNGFFSCFTEKGPQRLDRVNISNNENGPGLFESESCYYDKASLNFILVSNNGELRTLQKKIAVNDDSRIFVFDQSTSRYFYVVPARQTGQTLTLVPLSLVTATKDSGQFSYLILKCEGNVNLLYSLISGNMKYIGLFESLGSNCVTDASGNIFKQRNERPQNISVLSRQINQSSNNEAINYGSQFFNGLQNQSTPNYINFASSQGNTQIMKDNALDRTLNHYLNQKGVSSLPMQTIR